MIYAYQNRTLERNITIKDAKGNVIVPGPSDQLRATIGRTGETVAVLVVSSSAPTTLGSSMTLGSPNVLRLAAADLGFSIGSYTLMIDYFDYADGQSWKGVTREAFFLDDPDVTDHIADVSEVLLELGLEDRATDAERALVQTCIVKAEGAVRRYLQYDPVLRSHTEFHPQQAFQAQISRGVWEVMETRATLRQVSESATNEMQLQNLPVRYPITSVYVDYDGRSGTWPNSFNPGTWKKEGPDYWANYDLQLSNGLKICTDGIIRTIGLWPTTPGTIKVSYTAGYTPRELRGEGGTLDASPIWEVVINEAARRVRKRMVMKAGRLGLPAGVKTSEGLGDYNYSMDGDSIKELISGELTATSRSALSTFVNLGRMLGA